VKSLDAKGFDFSMAGLIVRLKLIQRLTIGFIMQYNKTVWLSIKLCLGLLISALTLSGCGGGCAGDACGTYAKYNVGGSVIGLNANGSVVLQNNAGDDLTVSSNGSFQFVTPVRNFKTYNVSVLTQPIGQTCTVSLGVGTVNVGDVSNVVVTCVKNPYTIGGSISGLFDSVILQNNGGDNLTLSSNGNFTFAVPFRMLQTYNITVLAQPIGQTCSVRLGTGSVNASNVSNVAVTCVTKPFVQMGGSKQGSIPLKLTGAVTTFAGTAGVVGSTNGTGGSASFNFPSGITTDGANLYVADGYNNIIRKIVIASGAVTTLAGSGAIGSANSTTGINATFNSPFGITTDGTNLYVADSGNNKIRKIVIASGAVTTLAGSGAIGSANSTTGTIATFNLPSSITTDGANLYVAERNNHLIRKIVIASGAVTTIAGSGAAGSANSPTGISASFNTPFGIATDGTNLYVADTYNNLIRKIVIASGAVTTLAGSGAIGLADNTIGINASFNGPTGIATDGTNLYVADFDNHMIRMIVIASGVVTTLAGSGTIGSADNTIGINATFNGPSRITSDGFNLFVTDSMNNIIRKIQ
jgi:sugar lactone lactonase YvrE